MVFCARWHWTVVAVVAMMAIGSVGAISDTEPGTSPYRAMGIPGTSTPPPAFSGLSSASGSARTAGCGAPGSSGTSGNPAPLAPVVARALDSGVNLDDIYVPGPAATPCQVEAATDVGHVIPQYSSSPAPLGLAELGLEANSTGGVRPFVLNTTSVQGTFDAAAVGGPNATDLLNSAPDAYGVQLNSVLTNVTLSGRSGYSFWTQDVLEYSPLSGQVGFVTNVWNWSDTVGFVGPSTFYQHGPYGNFSDSSLYYASVGPFPVSYPFNATLTMVSNITEGRDAVYFSANITSPSGDVNLTDFDYVIFNSITGSSPDLTSPSNYTADGFSYNAVGHMDDFELTIGGPGGGRQTTFLTANATETLDYLNASSGSYQAVPSAYSYGDETGETAVGACMSWATGGNGQPDGIMTTGPSLLGGLWNASSPSGGPGRLTVLVQPSNAFVFILYNGSSKSAFNVSEPEWAPTVETDTFTLPSGVYTVGFLESDYDPLQFPRVSVAPGVPVTLGGNLTLNRTQGIYTPLWAWSNAQIGNLSTSGNGTQANPYTIVNDQPAPFGYPFGEFNDLGYLVFPGVYFLGTTAYTMFVSPPSLAAYPGGDAAQPMMDLPWWFSNDSNIAILDAQNISGWFPDHDAALEHTFNVIVWDSAGFLVANDSFQTEAQGLLFYGGTGNVVWGNNFTQIDPPTSSYDTVPFFEGVGLAVDESGDTIYNNLFYNNPVTAESLATDIYGGEPVEYADTWNITPQAATNVSYAPNWPSFPLTGSIIGTADQGGNFWWDYGTVSSPWGKSNPYGILPYSEQHSIAYGGDFAPLLYTPIYTITANVTGLPASVEWDYYVANAAEGSQQFATGSATGPGLLEFNLTGAPVRAYLITAVALTGSWEADTVTLSVTGNATVDIVFHDTFNVRFTEAGLPRGIVWSVTLNGTRQSSYGVLSSLNFYGRVNGSYAFSLGAVNEYTSTPSSGSANVSGADVSINITFTRNVTATYLVSFSESGLPSGNWSVTINGTLVSAAVGTTLGANLTNGTYDYTIAAVAGYHQSTLPYSGDVVVSGSPVLEPTLVFSEVTYAVTFTESGLGARATWSVAIGTGSPISTSGGAINASEPNGTFDFQVTAVGYSASPSSGQVIVAGGTVTQSIVFKAQSVPAGVTFTETGLPTGTAWTVTFGGTLVNGTAPEPIVVRGLANATYTYSVPAFGPWDPITGGSGHVTFVGAAVYLGVTFVFVSPVTIEQTGIPDGTNWVVQVLLTETLTPGGPVEPGATWFANSTGPTAQFYLVNGTYSYAVSASGFQRTTGPFTVLGQGALAVPVSVSAVPSASGPSGAEWLLIGVVVVALILIAALVVARRRRPPAPLTPYTPPAVLLEGATTPSSSPPYTP
jgi:thermopsin